MTLDKELANWDGKSKPAIERVYTRYADQADFVATVLASSRVVPCQRGATWLLKRHVEQSGGQNCDASAKILALIPTLDHWESTLHLLQLIPFLSIPEKFETAVAAFARSSIEAENKFVRAWGYNALYELARQYPAHQHAVTETLKLALQDEPASVKARVRNVLAKGF